MRSSSRVSARMASRAATCSGSFLSTLASNASSARRSSSRVSSRTDPPKRSGLRETPEAGRGAIFAGRGARGARSGERESGAFGASRRAARGIGARAGVRECRTRRGRRLVSQPARGRRRRGTAQHVNTRVCRHQQIEGVRRVERVLTFRASSFSRPRAHDQARRVRAIALARARPSSRHHRARAFAPPRRRRAPRGHGERESSGAEESRGGEVEPTVER